MRRSALFLGLATAASASCVIKPCTGKCVRAVQEFPEVGEAFCSSFLSLEPVTTTVTDILSAVSTSTELEVVTSTLTITASTATSFAPTTTVFLKREVASASQLPAESISSACSFAASRISSACSCFLGTVSASTTTVTEASTSTAIYQETITSTEIVTASVVVTASATPTFLVPRQPVLNSGFEKYTVGEPPVFESWTIDSQPSGARIQPIPGINPCLAGGICVGTSTILRVYPPAGGYLGFVQTFVARPSTTYNFSFIYRCLNFDSTTLISVWYQGRRIGTANQCLNSAAFSKSSDMQFTTDATGTGEIQVRFENPSNLPYLYFYTDNFVATPATEATPI